MKASIVILTTLLISGAISQAEDNRDVLLVMEKANRKTAEAQRIEDARLSGKQYVVQVIIHNGNTVVETNDKLFVKLEGLHAGIAKGSSVVIDGKNAVILGKKYKVLGSAIKKD